MNVEERARGRHHSTLIALVSALGLLAVWTRVHNVLHYPPDWGFDAAFNWQYIASLSRDWSLPHPAAGWATADPPLYFYLTAALWRTLEAVGARDLVVYAVPSLSLIAGLGIVGLAVALVQRCDPGNTRRLILAAGLLLFLPAHVHMSVMVNEEILSSLFVAAVLFGLSSNQSTRAQGFGGLSQSIRMGFFAGLALLSKLTGVVAALVAAGTMTLEGLRTHRLGQSITRVAVLAIVTLLVGGWYFARNQIEYGYIQPFGLPAHKQMFDLPPGNRSIIDYLHIPLATWTDPQLLNPSLQHSVWGSTYATLWFDGHRSFLPVDSPAIQRLGGIMLLLALLPCAAFAVGLVRGVKRCWESPQGPDTALLLTVAATLLGYAWFTYRNPWYAVVKGTSLLALCLPFSYYASGELARWTRRKGWVPTAIWVTLLLLVVGTTVSSTFGFVFEKNEISGLPWEKSSP
ncbi:glycosyltransferase family 39 protein [Myxococcota bacterium]|nr:glycosyltransferase family 39 protein [Myxococcota bacterium]